SLGSIGLPLAADLQQAGKVWRIGFIGSTPPTTPEIERIGDAFRQALEERDYVEERHLAFERRYIAARLNTWDAAAWNLGMTLTYVDLSGPQDLDAATAAILRARGLDPVAFPVRREFTDFARRERLPMFAWARD